MSRANVTIMYIKGTENQVVDCLSRYYEDGGGEAASDKNIEWANADARLDPEGDDLPHDRWQELCLGAMTTRGNHPRQTERVLSVPREAQRVEAEEMATHAERSEEDNSLENLRDDPSLLESAGSSPDLPSQLRDSGELRAAIVAGYKEDPVLSKVWAHPEHHTVF